MASDLVERAVAAVRRTRVALLKFLSANDVGETASHQAGIYLPKEHWRLFATAAPKKGENHESRVAVTWNDDVSTDSRVKWYGKESRSEFRLTRFGRDLEYRQKHLVGALFVLVPESKSQFQAYVIAADEDVESVLAELGIELHGGIQVYDADVAVLATDECIRQGVERASTGPASFPPTKWFAETTADIVHDCNPAFDLQSPDDTLLQLNAHEYSLFRAVEARLVLGDVRKGFADADAFLRLANSVLNRRKSRAGKSLEHHFGALLRQRGIPFAAQARVPGKPDFLIPGEREYRAAKYDAERLVVVAVKTTCKDRWRQVLQEAPRAKSRYLLTLQSGVSVAQLEEMDQAGVQLVVPESLHSSYPLRLTKVRVLTVEDLLRRLQDEFGGAAGGVDLPLLGPDPADGDILR